MSLYLTMTYQVTKAQAAAAVTRSRLMLQKTKYVFDLGQGPLAEALTTYGEDIQEELGNQLELDVEIDNFATARAKHDPAHVLAIVSALRGALDTGGERIVARIAASWKSDTLMRAELADLETFCQFGALQGLHFSHSFD
jgi:hypothetical protein